MVRGFVVRTPCHATRSFFRSGVRFPGPLACLQARGIRGLCHSPPRLEDQCGLWKNKTSMRKKTVKPWLEEKINLREEKIPDKPFQHAKTWLYRWNSSWFVTSCYTYKLVCSNHQRKCSWRGRLMLLLCFSCDMHKWQFLYFAPKSWWWLSSAWNPDCPIVWVLW